MGDFYFECGWPDSSQTITVSSTTVIDVGGAIESAVETTLGAEGKAAFLAKVSAELKVGHTINGNGNWQWSSGTALQYSWSSGTQIMPLKCYNGCVGVDRVDKTLNINLGLFTTSISVPFRLDDSRHATRNPSCGEECSNVPQNKDKKNICGEISCN